MLMLKSIFCHIFRTRTFFYGVPNINNNDIKSKLFPYICSYNFQDVSFEDCTFFISDDKKTTARGILVNYLDTKNIFTYEVSFYGRNDIKNYQYN